MLFQEYELNWVMVSNMNNKMNKINNNRKNSSFFWLANLLTQYIIWWWGIPTLLCIGKSFSSKNGIYWNEVEPSTVDVAKESDRLLAHYFISLAYY